MERLRLTGKCDGSNLLILKPSPDVGMAPRKPNLTELSVFVPRGAVPQCRSKGRPPLVQSKGVEGEVDIWMHVQGSKPKLLHC